MEDSFQHVQIFYALSILEVLLRCAPVHAHVGPLGQLEDDSAWARCQVDRLRDAMERDALLYLSCQRSRPEL